MTHDCPAMSNKHIFNYLDYYVDLPHPPRYAVMLSGPWGIGKSYNVKKYLESLRKRGNTPVYVSLYGIKSYDEIAIAILAALAPMQDSKLVKVGGQLIRGLWKKLPFDGAADLIPESWCNLIVFDDLERANLSPAEVLGFVNAFIEHEERRVVLIANETELRDQETYRRIREKVIGMTFQLQEQSAEALADFIACTDDEATRTFLSAANETILEIFAQSDTHNLRILDQSLRSWERVYKAIAPELKKKDKGILAAFELFLALSLEVRAGRLSREDFDDRAGQIVRYNVGKINSKDAKHTPLSEAQERYGRICLHESILTDTVLLQVLCDGRIDPVEINASLAEHRLFVEPDQEPNWRKVWDGFLRDAQEFAHAFDGLEKEFADRAFDHPEVVLHVIGIRLWGAEIGQLARSESEIIAECKAYIDDLRRNGRLRRRPQKGFRDAALGLGFHNGQTPAFRELLTYYADQSDLAYMDTWQNLGQSLLSDMSGDVERFCRRICWFPMGQTMPVGQSMPDCADAPILSQIAPGLFADTLIARTPREQRAILEALNGRYETGRLEIGLAAEVEWINKVIEALKQLIPLQSPIRRYSLSHDIQRLLGPILPQANGLVHCSGERASQRAV
jgi:KAP family P-loop domain